MFKKQVLIKVLNPSTGALISIWKDALFSGYTKELNAGVGECIITLGRAFDYSGQDLSLGNDIEVIVSDRDTAEVGYTPGDPARTIYQGYISLIETVVEGGQESIYVHVLGHYTRLSLDYLKDTSGSTLTLYSDTTTGLTTVSSGSAADIGLIMRSVITKYRSESSTKINYIYDDIPDTGTTALCVFRAMTYREVLDKLRSVAPSGWYWYIDETNNVKFKPQPTTPTHKFYFGKHFTSVKVERSLEKERNTLFFWNGEPGTASPILKKYTKSDLVSSYGVRASFAQDYSVGNETTADKLADKFFAENQDPAVKITCVILDNNGAVNDGSGDAAQGYDIESIQPGDTCSFYGFDISGADIFRDNMLITKVNYTLDYAEIEVELIKSGALDVQKENTEKIKEISVGKSLPATYTT